LSSTHCSKLKIFYLLKKKKKLEIFMLFLSRYLTESLDKRITKILWDLLEVLS